MMSSDEEQNFLKKSTKQLQQKQFPQKFWEEMDAIEGEGYSQNEGKQKKKPIYRPRNGYIRRSLQKRTNQIRAYEQALKKHRETTWKFVHPFQDNITLNISPKETVELMRNAEFNDELMPHALRKIGLKRMQIILKCHANYYLNSVAGYLVNRRLPKWMKIKFDDLVLEKKKSK